MAVTESNTACVRYVMSRGADVYPLGSNFMSKTSGDPAVEASHNLVSEPCRLVSFHRRSSPKSFFAFSLYMACTGEMGNVY